MIKINIRDANETHQKNYFLCVDINIYYSGLACELKLKLFNDRIKGRQLIRKSFTFIKVKRSEREEK